MPNLHIRLRCGDDAKLKQTVELPRAVHAQHLTLQSVVVSTDGVLGSEIPQDVSAVIPNGGGTLATTGLHGILIKFGDNIFNKNDNIYAGSEEDHLVSGHVYVPIHQNDKTTVYNPQTVFGEATFPAEFDVELFYADAPQYPLKTAIESLHSIHLTFTFESGSLF